MDIFESLENLNVSEECFEDIVSIVEELLNERNYMNRQHKQNWEISKIPGSYNDNASKLADTEVNIKRLKRFAAPKEDDPLEQSQNKKALDTAVKSMSKESHELLGRKRYSDPLKDLSSLIRDARRHKGMTRSMSKKILRKDIENKKAEREGTPPLSRAIENGYI
jgi:hypothetical protein